MTDVSQLTKYDS